MKKAEAKIRFGFFVSLRCIMLIYEAFCVIICFKDVKGADGCLTNRWKRIAAGALCTAALNIASLQANAAVYVGPVNQTDISHLVEMASNESSGDIFLQFEEVSRERAIHLLNQERLLHAGTAGDEVYLAFEGGRQVMCTDESGDLLTYLLFLGVDPVEISFDELRGTQQEGAEHDPMRTWNPFVLVGACGVSLLFSVLATRRLRRSLPAKQVSVTVGVPEEVRMCQINVPKVRFSDVEGVDGLKQDAQRIVDCLKHPEKYAAIGARPTKGVILYGPPGTGKTLFAKAIAGEAGVPFFSCNGSDFVERYVGVGAKRVRELYAKARKSAPCIVFIDEIDAVARRRGCDENAERDQTVNALLAELDGFDTRDGVVTICATNRLDQLDDAFKRSGRFDLKLAVGLPDTAAREHILLIHAKGKKLSKEIHMDSLAKRCSGFSGADLDALLNEAAMCAAGRGACEIGIEDIDDAFFKIVLQGNKVPRKEAARMDEIIAWHEAGHTLAAKLLTGDKVSCVTIAGSSSGAGGVTFRSSSEGLHSRRYMRSSICVMYAGRAAEQILLKDPDLVTTGASADIKQATALIRDYVALYGMGQTGLLDLRQLTQDYTPIVEEAKSLSEGLYTETVSFLTEHETVLRRLAEALVERETLNEAEIDEILSSEI